MKTAASYLGVFLLGVLIGVLIGVDPAAEDK